jgi:hypothetical protein
VAIVMDPSVIAVSERSRVAGVSEPSVGRSTPNGSPARTGLTRQGLDGLLEDSVLKHWAEEMAGAKNSSPAVVLAALAIALEESADSSAQYSLIAG